MNRRQRHGVFLLPFLLASAACQTLPDQQEMTATACAELPCREAGPVVVLDAAGTAHFLAVPQGPRWAGGILSLVPGESAHLRWTEGPDGGERLAWETDPERADLSFRLEPLRPSRTGEHEGKLMRLRIHNRSPRDLYLEAEHQPAGDNRLLPLFATAVPAESRVQRSWPHLILEMQLSGWRALPGEEPHGTEPNPGES